MNQINLQNRLDDSSESVKVTLNEAMNAKKSPWYLRWPAAVLRPIGRLVSKAVSLGSAIIQPIRRRLNQWNWRKKTALVTALAITAGGVFYQHRAQAAAFHGPILATKSGDFFVKFFVGYMLNKGLEAAFSQKLKKTADATPDGEPLYSNREYYKRIYYYGDAATRNGGQNGPSVDAKADALYHKAYNTTGTDSTLDPSSLDQREVLDCVSDNANLTGRSDTYKILVEVGDGEWDHLYTDTNKYHNARQSRYYTVAWGGYVKKPTDAEIQAELDQMQEDWNNARTRRGWQRPIYMGNLKLGERTHYKREQFTGDKKIKLWSDFEHVAVPGSNDLSPTELEEQGSRSPYVTRFSYIAREAGYNGSIVTKVPKNERPRHDYPEPMSWCDDNFLGFDLTQIPWENFQIIDTPAWVGRAKRFFKYKKTYNYCTKHNTKHAPRRGRHPCRLAGHYTTLHEYPVYQNENVKKPSN